MIGLHRERHPSHRTGWLRAAVLGSNDAIVSTSSLMLGVAASSASRTSILIAGVSGLVAGSMSMAVGEYVSVSSQKDAELADLARESLELESEPQSELQELAGIYVKRGLDTVLALKVAEALSAKDRLGTHLRDELGIDLDAMARPYQAAWISASSFAVFALIPIAGMLLASDSLRIPVITASSVLSLVALGAFGAHLGGASRTRAALRVTVGGLIALGISAAIGHIMGVSIGS